MDIGSRTLVLVAALVAGLPNIRTLGNLQAGDRGHPEALRFDWQGRRYRTRLIRGKAYAETVVGRILESGPDSRTMEKYLDNGLRKVLA
jgi:hypothetical protein